MIYLEQMFYLMVRVLLAESGNFRKREPYKFRCFTYSKCSFMRDFINDRCNVQMDKCIELKYRTIIETLISLISNSLHSQCQQSPMNPIRSLEVVRCNSRSKPGRMNPPILNHVTILLRDGNNSCLQLKWHSG